MCSLYLNTMCNSTTVIMNRIFSICVRKYFLKVSNGSVTVRRIDTTYTRWSCYRGLANPVQIVSTPPAHSNGGPITVFW